MWQKSIRSAPRTVWKFQLPSRRSAAALDNREAVYRVRQRSWITWDKGKWHQGRYGSGRQVRGLGRQVASFCMRPLNYYTASGCCCRMLPHLSLSNTPHKPTLTRETGHNTRLTPGSHSLAGGRETLIEGDSRRLHPFPLRSGTEPETIWL